MTSRERTAEQAPVIWMMGPTSAGKTTLANALTARIQKGKRGPVVHWDGDQVRDMMGDQLGFSAESRMQVVRALATIAGTTSKAGILTIVSALTAHQDARQAVAEMLPGHTKIYVHCPIETCAERDPKGLYRRAKAGEISTLIGYNCTYEPPEDHELEIDTSQAPVEGCVDQLVEFLERRDMLGV
jgi:adenylyl-sulfate kinase